MDPSELERKAKSARRLANHRSYEKSKKLQDSILMRLEKGDLAALDAGAEALGLSRSAFMRMFLAPTLGAVAAHIPAIEAARMDRGHSFAQFIAFSIRTALLMEPPASETSEAADEFDKLFVSEDEDP
jgi:hypothetical protein